jgi:hypothetical protein
MRKVWGYLVAELGGKPYSERRFGKWIYREFNPSTINAKDLVWHRDKNSRFVIVLSRSNWLFQFDNQLPESLSFLKTIKIPSGTYHRVIPGGKKLKLLIKE